MNAPDYQSIRRLSAINVPRCLIVAVTIKSYLDGSGKTCDPANTHLTLGGLIATQDAWDDFEPLWNAILKRHGCRCLHMTDAFALEGEFSEKAGWTDQKVGELVCDLVNNCFNSVRRKHQGGFWGATCTVNLLGYKQACDDLPGLKQIKTAEAFCVDYVVTQALRALPQSDTDPLGKSGFVELYFDAGERFMHQIHRVWLKKLKKRRPEQQGTFRLINQVSSVSQAITPVPALQGADLLAWHARRGYMKEDGLALWASMVVPSATPLYLDYDEIIRRGKEILERQLSWDRPRSR